MYNVIHCCTLLYGSSLPYTLPTEIGQQGWSWPNWFKPLHLQEKVEMSHLLAKLGERSFHATEVQGIMSVQTEVLHHCMAIIHGHNTW